MSLTPEEQSDSRDREAWIQALYNLGKFLNVLGPGPWVLSVRIRRVLMVVVRVSTAISGWAQSLAKSRLNLWLSPPRG